MRLYPALDAYQQVCTNYLICRYLQVGTSDTTAHTADAMKDSSYTTPWKGLFSGHAGPSAKFPCELHRRVKSAGFNPTEYSLWSPPGEGHLGNHQWLEKSCCIRSVPRAEFHRNQGLGFNAKEKEKTGTANKWVSMPFTTFPAFRPQKGKS